MARENGGCEGDWVDVTFSSFRALLAKLIRDNLAGVGLARGVRLLFETEPFQLGVPKPLGWLLVASRLFGRNEGVSDERERAASRPLS